MSLTVTDVISTAVLSLRLKVEVQFCVCVCVNVNAVANTAHAAGGVRRY